MVKERNMQGLEQHLFTEKILYGLDYLVFPHHHQYSIDEEVIPLLQVPQACMAINYFWDDRLKVMIVRKWCWQVTPVMVKLKLS